MKLKSVVTLIAAMAGIATGGFAHAQDSDAIDADSGRHSKWMGQHGDQWGPRNHKRMIRGLTRRLELDDVQVEQLTNIVESTRPEFDLLRESGRAHREAMRELDVADPDYGAKLTNLATAKGEQVATATELQGRMRAEIYAILTPQQRETWAAAKNHRFPGRRHRNRHNNRDRIQPSTG